MLTLFCKFWHVIKLLPNFPIEIAEIYMKHDSWYYMPVSVHKIVFQSAKIFAFFVVPIGLLFEKAQEA